MRKMFFSLVATLAFGSFAMANSVDVETVEAVSVVEITKNISNLTLNEFVMEEMISNCYDIAYAQWEGLLALSGSDGNSDADITMLNNIVDYLCHRR